MSKIACIYFEGNESKVALFSKEDNNLKLIKAESIDTSMAFAEQQSKVVAKDTGAGKPQEMYNYEVLPEETASFNKTYLQKLNQFFIGEDLSKIKFIPILTEPAIYFQKVNDEKDLASLNINNFGKIQPTIGFVTLHDNTKLAVYPSGHTNYLQAIDSLARMNNRRFLKIPTVKSAEISLASYIARKRKFSEKETTLILYIGKDYSKIIFLKGEKLFQVGATLSVGKNSFNAHNVIVSKILLEMEHTSLSQFDNIIICGEDTSADLVSVISEAYPRSKVYIQKIKSVEIQKVDALSTESSFIVPASVAEEYFEELENKTRGINLLPSYIKEEQKAFHLGWQGYLLALLIFASVVFFGRTMTLNIQELGAKDREISKLLVVQAENKEAAQKISAYESKLQNVDKVKAVLTQLSTGAGLFSDQLNKLSNFANAKRNMWMSLVKLDANKNLKLSGFTFSRPVVKELSDSYAGSILENIVYEPLREKRAFKFSIDAGNLTGGSNDKKK